MRHEPEGRGFIQRESLNGTTLGDTRGKQAAIGFVVAPWVSAVALAADGSGDGAWSAGERIEVRLTFSEAVTVTTTDGTPGVGVSVGGTAHRAQSSAGTDGVRSPSRRRTPRAAPVAEVVEVL